MCNNERTNEWMNVRKRAKFSIIDVDEWSRSLDLHSMYVSVHLRAVVCARTHNHFVLIKAIWSW